MPNFKILVGVTATVTNAKISDIKPVCSQTVTFHETRKFLGKFGVFFKNLFENSLKNIYLDFITHLYRINE